MARRLRDSFPAPQNTRMLRSHRKELDGDLKTIYCDVRLRHQIYRRLGINTITRVENRITT